MQVSCHRLHASHPLRQCVLCCTFANGRGRWLAVCGSSTLCWRWGHEQCHLLSCRADRILKRRSHITIKVAEAADEVER